MTPTAIRDARLTLGLTQHELGVMLGYDPASARQMVNHIEADRRQLQEAQRRLLEAYLSGYRPADWPFLSEALSLVKSGVLDAAWNVIKQSPNLAPDVTKELWTSEAISFFERHGRK